MEEKDKTKEKLEDKIIKTMDESIETILEEGIDTENLETLYKVSKIKHMVKEEKEMYGNYNGYGNYSAGGNYGRGGYGAYGNNYGEYGRGSYGRRGVDSKYRGDDELDRMSSEYGRYQESRSYGNPEEKEKSFHYMVKALEDFVKILQEEVETPQQKQMLNEALQKSMR